MSELQEENALNVVRKLLDAGEDPLKIMDACGQAIEIVDKKYEDGVYFVPDLIFAGEILKHFAGSNLIWQKEQNRSDLARLS